MHYIHFVKSQPISIPVPCQGGILQSIAFFHYSLLTSTRLHLKLLTCVFSNTTTGTWYRFGHFLLIFILSYYIEEKKSSLFFLKDLLLKGKKNSFPLIHVICKSGALGVRIPCNIIFSRESWGPLLVCYKTFTTTKNLDPGVNSKNISNKSFTNILEKLKNIKLCILLLLFLLGLQVP